MKTLVLSLALLTSSAFAQNIEAVLTLDAQIAHLKAQRAATVKTLDPVSKAELRVLQAHEGLTKARSKAGKPAKAPQMAQRSEVLL